LQLAPFRPTNLANAIRARTIMASSLMYITIAGLIGALLGSFLNVVISRGPRAWGLIEANDKPAGLALPPSQCEVCGKRLGPLELIPIVSYIAQRGACRSCGTPIGLRHLIVELFGALALVTAVSLHGVTIEAALLATAWLFLIALALIDAETGFLPDALTLPLLAIGVLAAAAGFGPPLFQSLLGAAMGGGSLWLIATGYKRWRGRDGLGGGDVKLLGAAGAWLGPFALPYVVLIASLGGLLFVGIQMVRGKTQSSLSAELRFGPFLGGAIALALVLPLPVLA